MTTYIYALRDPRTNKTRYIGQSINPELRFYQHLVDIQNNCKGKWISELIGLNLKPNLEVLETVDDNEANEVEKHYIAKYIKAGCDLTNTQGKFVPMRCSIEQIEDSREMPEREESLSALAEMTGNSYNTLVKYAREGRFPARKSGGVWLSTRSAVEAAGIKSRS